MQRRWWGNTQRVSTNSAAITDFSLGPASFAGFASLGATGAVPARNVAGFIGGGQVGFNYQFSAGGFGSAWVGGLEADFQGAASSSSARTAANVVGPFPFFSAGETITTTIGSNQNLDFLGTVRGRIGFLGTPSLMIYGSGGLAYGGVTATTRIAQTNNDCALFPGDCIPPLAFTSGRLSETRTGWTLGGGVEWMFMPNWSAKIEYLYYDLGRAGWSTGLLAYNSGSLAFAGGPAIVASRSSAGFNASIVRAGVSYHFN